MGHRGKKARVKSYEKIETPKHFESDFNFHAFYNYFRRFSYFLKYFDIQNRVSIITNVLPYINLITRKLSSKAF